jgi:hypothetical protein
MHASAVTRANGDGRRRAAVPPIVHEVLASPGQSLDSDTRELMELSLGYDFGRVRVHTDARSTASAAALSASAYTVGPHVVFGAGQYSPASSEGRQLIAHELTHVVQQARGPGPLIQRRDGRAPRPAAAAARAAPVVGDGQPLAAGQMHRSAFLTKLRDRLIQACDAELRPFGRTAQGCPYILRTIERYRTRPTSELLRLIQHFAHPPVGASADGLIEAVTQQARVVSRRLGEKHGDPGRRPQAMPERGDGLPPALDATAIQGQLGSGRPLEGPIRATMEDSFGTSFASVRVHDDPTAAQLNAALGARAFTVGNNIAFAAGQYRPRTVPGDRLIAHELAHTLQQGAGTSGAPGKADDQALERQADRAAADAVTGREGAATSLLPGERGLRVQRWPAIVAGAIVVAEAAPEVAVVAEVAAVSTAEVAVVDTALVVTVETAPLLAESLVPAALESVAPVAVETLAPTAASTFSTTAAVVGTGLAATTLSSDQPTEEEPKRKCRPGPCEHPLPISWPVELPYPTGSPRMLVRTTSVEREWEGIDRAADQSRLAQEIRRARQRLIPPPQPCFEDDAEPNAPYDAHHRHPLYLGGEEAPYNLCALRADRHQAGHPRLNNQTMHLAEYMECGICSGFLSQHPAGQAYQIISSK